MRQLSQLPLRAGVGFKPEHFVEILDAGQIIGFVEVHAENYMGAGGRPHAQLSALRSRLPLSIHGVGLSIGSMQPLDRAHLARLKVVCDRYQPDSFSEHLAWSSHDNVFFNDLLPLPYTAETLARVAEHIDTVQTALKREILLENPSTYVTFAESDIPEPHFLQEIARRTGCGLLLDVNNVFVSASNHRLSADSYLAAFPLECVKEIHLGGHDEQTDGQGALLIDAHGCPVADLVWALYEKVLSRIGPVSSLIEWDNNVPSWAVLEQEARKAQSILDLAAKARAA